MLFPQTRSTELRAIHTYSARMPKECLSAMAFSFRSEEFVSRYHVPSYVEWLQRCDMTPAYEMHRLVLQVLQRRMPARRWVLKSPVHLQALPTLVATYPDASFVVTHRDPVAVLSSVSSLVATVRAAFSDRRRPDRDRPLPHRPLRPQPRRASSTASRTARSPPSGPCTSAMAMSSTIPSPPSSAVYAGSASSSIASARSTIDGGRRRGA